MSKVLTIKEPYVTPIALGKKHYETRSWKTNYRGEIYIHTAKTKMPFPVDTLYYKPVFPLGHIVMKVKLTDCIYMDQEFIDSVDIREKSLGFYEVGRYAWKLEDVEVLETPIKANGKLGIWEVKI